MKRPLDPAEEHILAAFMSGELPEHLRREIISYLAGNDPARDLLAMAQEAMDAAEAGDGSPRKSIPEMRLPASGGRKWLPTSPILERNLWKITAFFAGAVLVLALIVAVMAMNTSRLQEAIADQPWAPVVRGEHVSLEWEQVQGATEYHIMHYDLATRRAAIVGTTIEPRFALEKLDERVRSQAQPVWVLAFGPDGQFLDRSTEVRLQSAD